MIKKIPYAKIVRCATIITLLFISVTGSFAQTKRYVKPLATGTADGSSWANASGSLQTIITGSIAGDSVFVMKGTYQPALNTSFIMKEGVKIYGSFIGTETKLAERAIGSTSADSSILMGNGKGVIVNSNTGLTTAAILDGFKITGGNATATRGGGMYNNFCSPTISNCSFSGNTATFVNNIGGGDGGAINNSYCSPVIINCSFSGNTAFWGAGMYNYYSSPTISYCSFLENAVFPGSDGGAQGGGMYNFQSYPVISNCSFVKNTSAAGTGGAIHNQTSFSTISFCIFSENTAMSGGAIYTNYFDQKISNCIFSGNKSTTGTGGGAIYNYYNNSIIVNCTFSGNTAPAGSGIYNNNLSYPVIKNVIINGGNNGGIFNNNSVPVITNSLIQGMAVDEINHNVDGATDPMFVNVATGNFQLQTCSPAIGGGDTVGISRYLNNKDLANNNRYVGTIDMGAYEYQGPSTYNYNNTIGSAQSIAINTAPATLTGSTSSLSPGTFTYIWQNSTIGDSTGFTTISNSNVKDYTPPVLTVSTWYRRLIRTVGSCTDTSSTLKITLPYARFYVKRSNLGGNDLNDGRSWATAFATVGHAIDIALKGDTIFVMKGNFFSNPSFVMKEGVKMFGSFAGTETSVAERVFGVTIADSTNLFGVNNNRVIDNTSNHLSAASILDGFTVIGGKGAEGAGMYNLSSSPTIRNCVFTNNTATNKGAAMYNKNSSPTIINCSFINNTVTGSQSLGGGMYNASSSPVISNSIFSGNTAMYKAGAIYDSAATLTISNCSFTGNKSISAIYGNGGGAIYNDTSSSTITNSTFTGNISNSMGGGIFNESSSSTISNCNFTANTSGRPGAGIYNITSRFAITHCNFTANTTTDEGSGIYNDRCSGTISNCNFSANIGGFGGGLFNNTSSPVISNCNFSANKVEYGGGMYNLSSSPTISNCIFSKNIASIGGGILNESSSPKISNSSFASNFAMLSGVAWGGGIINVSSFPQIKNCIVYGNVGKGIIDTFSSASVITYSLVQDTPADALKHNLNGSIDPMFTDTVNNNLRLLSGSPCINAGDTVGISQYIGTIDLAGNPRYAGIIDMGAYEFVATVATTYTFTGNGNWTDVANWLNSNKPPAQLPSGSQIIVAGNAVLDTPQTILQGASITVQTGYTLSLPLNLTIQ